MKQSLLSLFLLLTLCTACAEIKQADAVGGLLLVPYVNAVTINDHQYIRLVGKKSVALIDPLGGHVVEFYLQNRARFQLFQNEAEAKKIESPASPNVLQKDPLKPLPGQTWTMDGPDRSHYWQSEAWTVGITMLSDREGALGGFYRKTFELSDDGSLNVLVERVGKPATIRSAKPAPKSEVKTHATGQVIKHELQYDDTAQGWTEKWTINPEN